MGTKKKPGKNPIRFAHCFARFARYAAPAGLRPAGAWASLGLDLGIGPIFAFNIEKWQKLPQKPFPNFVKSKVIEIEKPAIPKINP